MGSNKTIRLSSWLPPPYGSRAKLTSSSEASAAAESKKTVLTTAGDGHHIICGNDPRQDDAAILTLGDLKRLLDGASNVDGRAEQIQKAIQVFATGIEVQIEKMDNVDV